METKLATNRKVRHWLDDNKKTKSWLAKELGISRPTLNDRLRDNFFSAHEIVILKNKLGIE